MRVQSNITWVGEVQSGTSKNGNRWEKQSFIVEYLHGEYPKSIMFDIMDTSIVGKLRVGIEVSVDFDIEVRRWTTPEGVERRFNEFRIWRNGLHSVMRQVQPKPLPQPQPVAPVAEPVADDSDLPF